MDNLFKLVDERVRKYLSSSPYVIAIPCVVLELFENEMVRVRLISNNTIFTVPNWSGSSLNVGENVHLFYRGNVLTERNAYIGASLNKTAPATYLQADVYTGALLDAERTIAELNVRNLTENILLIFNANIQGDASNQGNGFITIYIDDKPLSYSPSISTIAGGNTHLSFTIPITLSLDSHNIIIQGSGDYTTLTSINAYIWGDVVSAEPPFVPTDESDYIYHTDTNNSYIDYFIGEEQYISVPKQLKNLDVKILESTSFNYTDVKSVYIPEGIEEIR